MVKEILIFDEMWEGGEVNGKAGVVQLILLATYYGLNGGMIADGEMMVIGGKMMVDRKWASTDQEVLPGAGQGSHHLSLPPPPISKRESWEVSCILPFLFWCTHVQPRAPIISHSNLPFRESVWEVEPKWMFWKPFKGHLIGGLPPFDKICWKKFPNLQKGERICKKRLNHKIKTMVKRVI